MNLDEVYCDICDQWVFVNDDGDRACGHEPDDDSFMEWYIPYDENGDPKELDFGDD